MIASGCLILMRYLAHPSLLPAGIVQGEGVYVHFASGRERGIEGESG